MSESTSDSVSIFAESVKSSPVMVRKQNINKIYKKINIVLPCILFFFSVLRHVIREYSKNAINDIIEALYLLLIQVEIKSIEKETEIR